MTNPIESPRNVEIDFMFIDLEACTRCRGTDSNLEAALDTVRGVLEAAGAEVAVRKTLVDTEAKARELDFVSSPTIRVNGKDIALELRESRCDSCEEACGCEGTVDCRVWLYRGAEYTVAPVPMILDAILTEVYGDRQARSPQEPTPGNKSVPETLKRFFASKAAKLQATCCSEGEQANCCDASDKESCCAHSEAQGGSCGCR